MGIKLQAGMSLQISSMRLKENGYEKEKKV